MFFFSAIEVQKEEIKKNLNTLRSFTQFYKIGRLILPNLQILLFSEKAVIIEFK